MANKSQGQNKRLAKTNKPKLTAKQKKAKKAQSKKLKAAKKAKDDAEEKAEEIMPCCTLGPLDWGKDPQF